MFGSPTPNSSAKNLCLGRKKSQISVFFLFSGVVAKWSWLCCSWSTQKTLYLDYIIIWWLDPFFFNRFFFIFHTDTNKNYHKTFLIEKKGIVKQTEISDLSLVCGCNEWWVQKDRWWQWFAQPGWNKKCFEEQTFLILFFFSFRWSKLLK